MRVVRVEKKKAASLGPAAGTVNQMRVYLDSAYVSRRSRLEFAADVLTLMAFFPLSAAERKGFSALLERRLRRAYEGECQ